MPYAAFSIAISDVVDLLDLKRNPRDKAGASSFNVVCPFCGEDGKYKMNINTVKNVYFCPRCMDSSLGNSGALDLYGRVRFGTPLRPRENGRELYFKLCTELEGSSHFTGKESCARPLPAEIEPAPDEALDRAYRALLSLPYLVISRHHGNNLLNRGLDCVTIRSSLYASLRDAKRVVNGHDKRKEAYAWYKSHKVDSVRAGEPLLRNYSKEELLAGVLIARDLLARGINLERVPGFFKLAGTWCFRYDQGMLIPTMNYEGLIVGMQVRRDVATKSGLRYMTVSSKGLEGGVTTKIARTHVAKNGAISKDTKVYITEGPLKANVILHLLESKNNNGNVAIVAVQGVNNTKELPMIIDKLLRDGVTEAISALDMDKCGNMSVAQAGRTIKKLFEDKGIHMTTLCWDKEYALIKREELTALCEENHIAIANTENVYDDIYTMSSALSAKKIPYDVIECNGKKYKNHWREETKGMDDYLFFLQKK